MRHLHDLLIVNPCNLDLNRKRKAWFSFTRAEMRLHVHPRVFDVLSSVARDSLDGAEEAPGVASGEELLGVGALACSTEGLGHRERDGDVERAVDIACY